MTDQPHDEPQPHDAPAAGDQPADERPGPDSDPTAPVPQQGSPTPPDAGEPGHAPSPPPPPGVPASPDGPHGPPPAANPYGAPPAASPSSASPESPYGATPPPPPPPAPYTAAPTNPYGGVAAAPAYTGGVAMHPGSLGYVQQYFGPVASFGQRALALLIDTALTLVGLVPMVIGIIVLVLAAPTTSTYDEFGNQTLTGGDSGQAVVGGVLIALGVIVSIAISVWNRVFRMGRRGQSVGKSVIGLMLIDDKTGQPIGAGMCFLREIVHSIVNQVFYLSYLWMLWDTDKQTLGDKAVHSTVIVVPKA